MTKQDFIRKLTSRKLWLAVAAFVSGLIVAFGGEAGMAETVAGIILQGASVLGYLLAEGLADAKRTEAVITLDGIPIEAVDGSRGEPPDES